ncbi:MAG: hypothetical protein ACHP6I_01515 [Rickettsiales bacterium]
MKRHAIDDSNSNNNSNNNNNNNNKRYQVDSPSGSGANSPAPTSPGTRSPASTSTVSSDSGVIPLNLANGLGLPGVALDEYIKGMLESMPMTCIGSHPSLRNGRTVFTEVTRVISVNFSFINQRGLMDLVWIARHLIDGIMLPKQLACKANQMRNTQAFRYLADNPQHSAIFKKQFEIFLENLLPIFTTNPYNNIHNWAGWPEAVQVAPQPQAPAVAPIPLPVLPAAAVNIRALLDAIKVIYNGSLPIIGSTARRSTYFTTIPANNDRPYIVIDRQESFRSLVQAASHLVRPHLFRKELFGLNNDAEITVRAHDPQNSNVQNLALVTFLRTQDAFVYLAAHKDSRPVFITNLKEYLEHKIELFTTKQLQLKELGWTDAIKIAPITQFFDQHK